MTDLLERIKSHLSILQPNFARKKAPCLLLESAREIERLRMALVSIEHTIGPLAPTCDGCREEINEVLRIVRGEHET